MEIKRTYSLVDIAERLGRPRTTLADWARQFREFLPTIGSGRTMRYNEEALEVFGLISKMKDANEPPEYIKDQLRGMVTEIIVPMTDDDDGKPYLMHLAGEVGDLKRAVVMLAQQMEAMTTANDEARREDREQIKRLMEMISQQQEAAAALPSPDQQRGERLNEKLTERRIERQLEREALDLWATKPEGERMRRVGLFRKEEDAAARDIFVRDYVDKHFEERIRGEYGTPGLRTEGG